MQTHCCACTQDGVDGHGVAGWPGRGAQRPPATQQRSRLHSYNREARAAACRQAGRHSPVRGWGPRLAREQPGPSQAAWTTGRTAPRFASRPDSQQRTLQTKSTGWKSRVKI